MKDVARGLVFCFVKSAQAPKRPCKRDSNNCGSLISFSINLPRIGMVVAIALFD